MNLFLLLCFFNVVVKYIFGHFKSSIKGWMISLQNYKTCKAKNKKVNKCFKIWCQFQYSITRPNDIIHTQVTIGNNNSNWLSTLWGLCCIIPWNCQKYDDWKWLWSVFEWKRFWFHCSYLSKGTVFLSVMWKFPSTFTLLRPRRVTHIAKWIK